MRLWCWRSFNSLSRDHKVAELKRDVMRFKAFNSLSRDHFQNFPMSGCLSLSFQLPLSGSLLQLPSKPSPRGIPAFNSLSRDHTPRLSRPTRWSSLSTPSLGITGLSDPNQKLQKARTFNSLSRDHLRGTTVRLQYGLCFAFNSLSRDHRARFRDFSALRGFLPRSPFAQMISEATIWIYRSAPL